MLVLIPNTKAFYLQVTLYNIFWELYSAFTRQKNLISAFFRQNTCFLQQSLLQSNRGYPPDNLN